MSASEEPGDANLYAPVSERFIKLATWMLGVAAERRWLTGDDAATSEARRHLYKQGAEWLTNFSGLVIRERTRLVGVNLALNEDSSRGDAQTLQPQPRSTEPAEDYEIPPALAVAFARAVAGVLPGWDTPPGATSGTAGAVILFAEDFLDRAAYMLDGLRDVAGPQAETLLERFVNDADIKRTWAWNEDGGWSDPEQAAKYEAERRRLHMETQHTILLAIDRLDLLATIIQSERDRLLLQQ